MFLRDKEFSTLLNIIELDRVVYLLHGAIHVGRVSNGTPAQIEICVGRGVSSKSCKSELKAYPGGTRFLRVSNPAAGVKYVGHSPFRYVDQDDINFEKLQSVPFLTEGPMSYPGCIC
jgi:hypothetical protein